MTEPDIVAPPTHHWTQARSAVLPFDVGLWAKEPSAPTQRATKEAARSGHSRR
jgi:hypothetical protein